MRRWSTSATPTAAAPTVGTQPRDQVVSVGQAAVFTVAAFGAGWLDYQWERAGTGSSTFAALPGATNAALRVAAVTPADNLSRFRCSVRNDSGEATSAAAMLMVTANRPPVATITTPVAGSTYRGGMTVAFSGNATDPENGPLPGTALTWWVDFHHHDHVHPFLARTSG